MLMTVHCIAREYLMWTIAAYPPCFGQALDMLQGKVVTHLEKLNGGEL